MQKRFQALLLSALMVWALGVPVGAQNPFVDVPTDHWAYDSIETLAAAGLIEGYPDGTFGGSRNFTRYEMAMVFARILASFETYIADLVQQGLVDRTADLAEQVSAAKNQATTALAEALEAQSTADEALRVATQAGESADAALAAIDELQGLVAALAADRTDLLDELAEAEAVAAQVAAGTAGTTRAADWQARAAAEGAHAAAEAARRVAEEALGLAADPEALERAEQAYDLASRALDLAIQARAGLRRADLALERANEALARADRALAAAQAVRDASPEAMLLTEEARAAVEELAAAAVRERLEALEADVEAVAVSAGASLTPDEARAIAERVVAAEVAGLDVDALAAQIEALAVEFRGELQVLGVRVTNLESMFTALEGRVDRLEARVSGIDSDLAANTADIGAIRAEMARVRLFGTNETIYDTGQRTSADALVDPRDKDSDEFEVPDGGTELRNILALRIESSLADDVHVRVGVDLESDLGQLSSGLVDDIRAFAEYEAPGVVRLARLGDLEVETVAAQFNRFTIDPEELGRQTGGFARLQIVNATHEGFIAHSEEIDDLAFGLASRYELNPNMDFTFAATGVPGRNVFSVASSGTLDSIEYDGLVAFDVNGTGTAVEAGLRAPLLGGRLTAEYDRIDAVWGDANRYPFAAEFDLAEETKIDKPIDADQSRMKLRAEIPVLGFTAWTQLGQYDTEMTVGRPSQFTQLGVTDLRLEQIDIDMTYHRRDWTNPSVAGEENQEHWMVSLERPMQILLPLTASAQFGSSRTAVDGTHSSYGIALEEYRLLPRVTVDAAYVRENNLLDDGDWFANADWTGQNETRRSVGALWNVHESIDLSAGLSVADNDVEGTTVTQDAGIEYRLGEFFGGDVTLGYEYRVVTKDGTVDGAARNILRAAFEKSVGGFVLNAEGKYVTGGTDDEDGNERDTVANFSLKYPVFTGADFTMDGRFVRSEGAKAAEYSGHRVTAGLKVHF